MTLTAQIQATSVSYMVAVVTILFIAHPGGLHAPVFMVPHHDMESSIHLPAIPWQHVLLIDRQVQGTVNREYFVSKIVHAIIFYIK